MTDGEGGGCLFPNLEGPFRSCPISAARLIQPTAYAIYELISMNSSLLIKSTMKWTVSQPLTHVLKTKGPERRGSGRHFLTFPLTTTVSSQPFQTQKRLPTTDPLDQAAW